eukprot:CAMPEP_0115118526 /NCGR_PEP_ID=MMETSP0227-20121206/44544_1 /TAXON_ID=89957 /ORGANISM="Polarella glacialis, Strain CCMP 1383" /LENGTH=148 /DNA_ID=CAMNT_0002519813 /DNA_START=227 /DNA_END=670 /DNA_ORIENTATION=+
MSSSRQKPTAPVATQSPLLSGIVGLVSAHRESTPACGKDESGTCWRLPDDMFLLSLLSMVCDDKVHRAFKRRCFQALRANEADAARSVQVWWKWQRRPKSNETCEVRPELGEVNQFRPELEQLQAPEQIPQQMPEQPQPQQHQQQQEQ